MDREHAFHETRTALALIRGWAQMIVRRVQRGDVVPDQIAEAGEMIVEQSRRIERSLHDLERDSTGDDP